MVNRFASKFRDSLVSILPITFLVVILSCTIIPVPTENLVNFLISCILLVVGISFFTMGADTAMFPMGQHLGGNLSRKQKPWLLFLCCFVLGVIITIAEPDLSVLASQVESVNNWVFIIAVSVGVGLFLVLGVMRVLFGWNVGLVLLISYLIIFLLIIFVDQGIIPVSFDSGSVTTGPISVPFLIAFSTGIAVVRGSGSKEDSFGLVGFASCGPILVVMLLFCILGNGSANAGGNEVLSYGTAFLKYLKDVAIILGPIIVFFAIFQIFSLKLPKKEILKIVFGLILTYIGIVVFLVGVNVGFLPIGEIIGQKLALDHPEFLIPICTLVGFCMAMVEPAVQVLSKQIESISGGTIKRWVIMLCIAFGVALALLLCGIRLLTHISILWILIPAYAIVFILCIFAPKLFIGVAFDSGGVATGAIATTFAMPMIIGACESLGGNVMLDAFGTLAFVAVAPILVILVFGVIYKLKERRAQEKEIKKQRRVDIVEYD